jgi:hypothetical protein
MIYFIRKVNCEVRIVNLIYNFINKFIPDCLKLISHRVYFVFDMKNMIGYGV